MKHVIIKKKKRANKIMWANEYFHQFKYATYIGLVKEAFYGQTNEKRFSFSLLKRLDTYI